MVDRRGQQVRPLAGSALLRLAVCQGAAQRAGLSAPLSRSREGCPASAVPRAVTGWASAGPEAALDLPGLRVIEP